MTTYSFSLLDPSGNFVALITPNQLRQFSYDLEINSQGSLQLNLSTALESTLSRQLAVYQANGLDAIITMYRRPQRADGTFGTTTNYQQFLIRHEQDDYANFLLTQTTIAVTPHHLLSRAMIYPPGPLPLQTYFGNPSGDNVATVQAAFDADTQPKPTSEYWPSPTDPFEPVDTAQQMLNLVLHCKINTPQALSPITAATVASGGIVDHRVQLAYEANLLKVLREMSDASWYAYYYAQAPSPVDFGLEYNGVNSWIFVPYVGGYGEDKRVGHTDNPIVLSIARANVSNLSFTYDRLKEVTKVIVAGKTPEKRGEDTDVPDVPIRDIVAVNSYAAQQDSPWNVNEVFENASKVKAFKDEGGVLDAHQEGGRIFREDGIALSFDLTVPVSSSYVLGMDYDLGTLLTLFIDGVYMDVQIYKLKVTVTPQGETVTLSVRTLDSRAKSGASVFWRIVDAIEKLKDKNDYVAIDSNGNGVFPP